ncbi:uncharacterized protein TM35_000054120 [Trypanosoma theileri]|uniref:J domain-containing protein n=1 Tax=Trypanosoma theileri TaxID=67003 RepID=A0A1X0P4F3_9TRYP|nr:uncharacterized protein TM35_000054120 [Trypanosoma theileri]ORC91816.1 hypothetical protein TM35_000054120 [Trypanosoma theileri]
MSVWAPRAIARCGLSRHLQSVNTLQIPHSVNTLHTVALTLQRRGQFAQVPGKRDQEAFLSQFDPLDVLALNSDCTVDDIDAAFHRLQSKYAPNGPSPDAKMLDRVCRAHEILKDPGSPYYLRAHTSEVDRQRLQFQMLPKSKRQLIQVQVGMLMVLVAGLTMLVISLMVRPIKRSLRAATR